MLPPEGWVLKYVRWVEGFVLLDYTKAPVSGHYLQNREWRIAVSNMTSGHWSCWGLEFDKKLGVGTIFDLQNLTCLFLRSPRLAGIRELGAGSECLLPISPALRGGRVGGVWQGGSEVP